MLLFVAIAAIAVGVVVQILVPGRPLYHYGWYNVALAAILVIVIMQARRLVRNRQRNLWPAILVAFGSGVLALAGIANGLLAPDDATILGVPGASVRVDDLRGSLVFPLAESADGQVVRVERGGVTEIPPRGVRFSGANELWQVPRNVVAVEAADPYGAHLTITQPTGTFLSPVLMMPSIENVGNMQLPADTFAVPAAHRIVKVWLFDTRHAKLLRRIDARGGPAVLFAVDDETDRPLPHNVALALDGQAITLAGLRLRPLVEQYPAIAITPVPMPAITLLGLLLILAGSGWFLRLRHR
jgi:hypothetical protein